MRRSCRGRRIRGILEGMRVWLLISVVCLLTATASADEILWYGGDTDFVTAIQSGYGFGQDSNLYDDFRVGAGGIVVTHLFGNFTVIDPDPFTVGDVEYEIRSGMSAGNGGSLLAQGVIGASQIDRGRWNQHNLYEITTDLLNISLAPGTYWMSIAPLSSQRTFIVTTGGEDGIGSPLGNGNAFWNAPWYPAHFAAVEDVLGHERNWDFSYGVIGKPIPEPMCAFVLISGGVVVATKAFRQRARKVKS